MRKETSRPLDNPSPQRSSYASNLYCPYCEYITRYPSAILIHISKYHESVVAAEGKRGLGGKETANPYANQVGMVTCPHCGVSWGNQKWLEGHLAGYPGEPEYGIPARAGCNARRPPEALR